MESKLKLCSVCGEPTAVCNTTNHRGGLTINRIKPEEINTMANREILISKERIYLTEDKTRAVGQNDPERKHLLVGKGGEIERSVAEFYGLSVEEGLSVSIVTPMIEDAYNDMKRVRQTFPEQKIRDEVGKSIDAKNLALGAGVSMQASMLAEGVINQNKADANATPGVDHTTPQPAAGVQTLSDPANDDNPENDNSGQAQELGANTRSKTFGKNVVKSTDDTGEADSGKEATIPGKSGEGDPNDLTSKTLEELGKE